MREQKNFSEQGVIHKLEKIFSVALTKLKNIWHHENTPTGIQFYVESDD